MLCSINPKVSPILSPGNLGLTVSISSKREHSLMDPMGILQNESDMDLKYEGLREGEGYFSCRRSAISSYATGENIVDTSDSKLPNLLEISEFSEIKRIAYYSLTIGKINKGKKCKAKQK